MMLNMVIGWLCLCWLCGYENGWVDFVSCKGAKERRREGRKSIIVKKCCHELRGRSGIFKSYKNKCRISSGDIGEA